MTKTCSKCGLDLDMENFTRDARNRDGLQSQCNGCRNAQKRVHYSENPEQIKARTRSYNQKNLGLVRQRCRDYRQHTLPVRREQDRLRKPAEYEALRGTWVSFFRTTWNSINQRTINGGHPNWNSRHHRHYLDKGIRVEMDKEGYRQWCESNREEIEQMYREGKRPSIDRINSDLHYSLGNIRVLPLRDNVRKAA